MEYIIYTQKCSNENRTINKLKQKKLAIMDTLDYTKYIKFFLGLNQFLSGFKRRLNRL